MMETRPVMQSAGATPQIAIATFNEGPLHTALKAWYARSGDMLEVPIDGRQIDIVRGDLLIEIQTRNLAALRRKLEALLAVHRVRLVYPVAFERWILRVEGDKQEVTSRRRSPRRGRLEHAFKELVSLAKLLSHPRFECEIVLTREEELRRHEPGRAWRRKGWVVIERRLLDVVESHVLRDAEDLRRTLPRELPDPFTTTDLAERLGISPALAQKMAYCLRVAEVITVEGKRGNSRTYRVPDPAVNGIRG